MELIRIVPVAPLLLMKCEGCGVTIRESVHECAIELSNDAMKVMKCPFCGESTNSLKAKEKK